MKLSIVADKLGKIHGIAVCQVFFSDDPTTPREVIITGKKLKGSAESAPVDDIECYTIEAPPGFDRKSKEDQSKTLLEMHTSMYLHFEGDSARLKKRH